MQRANVNDPRSLEAVYDRAAFERDASRNAMADAAVHHGLRIESAPDGEGWFGVVPARHHVGEAKGEHSVFLFPHRRAEGGGGPEVGFSPSQQNSPAERRDEYEAFLRSVLEAARRAEFPDAIGRGEERLKGFHGG